MYKIKPYSYKQANRLGVTIYPSTNKNKKIDVFKGYDKVASIGDVNYKDYPSYLESEGIKVANDRRRLYKLRHSKYSNRVGTPSYYSYRILW